MPCRSVLKIAALSAFAAFAPVSIAAPAVTITFDTWIFGTVGDADRNLGNAAKKDDDYDNVSINFESVEGKVHTWSASAGRFVGQASKLVDVSPSVFYTGVDKVLMYCYDIFQDIGGGQSAVYDIDFNGAVYNTLHFLHAVNSVLSADQAYDPYAWTKPTTGHQAAAIQIGIWESLYERGDVWNVAKGQSESFWVTGLHGQTQSALGEFFKARSSEFLDPQYTMVLRSDTRQDMITADPPATSEVPEPATLALLAGGLLGLGLMRRGRA